MNVLSMLFTRLHLCLPPDVDRNTKFENLVTWLNYSLLQNIFVLQKFAGAASWKEGTHWKDRRVSPVQSHHTFTTSSHSTVALTSCKYVCLLHRFTMVFSESPNMSMLQWVPDPANPRNFVRTSPTFPVNPVCFIESFCHHLQWPPSIVLSSISDCLTWWRKKFFNESRANDVTRIGTSDLFRGVRTQVRWESLWCAPL